MFIQGELEHRHAKRFYARTNKVRYEMQIAQKQRRRALLHALRTCDKDFIPLSESRRQKKDAKKATAEARQRYSDRSQQPEPSNARYEIAQSHALPEYMFSWLGEHQGDSALSVSN